MDAELSQHEKRLVIVFWWLFAVAAAVLSPMPGTVSAAALPPTTRAIVSPVMLLFAWWVAHGVKNQARALVRRLPGPPVFKFGVVASLAGIALATRFAFTIDLGTDAAAARVITVLTYFGVYTGAILGWYALRYFYEFDHHQVFWVGGLMFALFEPTRAVLVAVLTGDLLGALLMLAYLIPVFGVPFGIVFLFMPREELPRKATRPGWIGYALLSGVPILLYHGWAPVWLRLLDLAISATV